MTKIIRKKVSIILVIFAVSLILGLQQSVAPVLSQIQEHYPNASVSAVQMLITAPLIVAIFSSLFSGYMVSFISKKKLLLLSAVVAGVVDVLPLVSDNFELLLLSRVLYGFSMGLSLALNAAVVADNFGEEERSYGMGIQSACVGLGILIITAVSSAAGAQDFKRSYLVNLLAFVSFFIILVFLPDRGAEKKEAAQSMGINANVIGLAIFGFFESVFFVTFSTNISMHLSAGFSNSSQIAGIAMGIFSISQILIGLMLGRIASKMHRMTLPFAVISFVPGAMALLLFPDRLPFIIIGAVFCGFTQGMFIPQASTEVTNAVEPSSVPMAAAVLSCGICVGELVSPMFTNGLAVMFFQRTSTTAVFTIAAAAMALISLMLAVWETGKGRIKSTNVLDNEAETK